MRSNADLFVYSCITHITYLKRLVLLCVSRMTTNCSIYFNIRASFIIIILSVNILVAGWASVKYKKIWTRRICALLVKGFQGCDIFAIFAGINFTIEFDKFCTNIIWALCTPLYLPNFLIECILLGHAHGTAALMPRFSTLCPLVCQPPPKFYEVNCAS